MKTSGVNRTSRRFYLAGLVLAAILVGQATFAQPEPLVTFAPDTATIGDPFTLQITLPEANPERITWPDSREGTLGDFILLEADTLSGRDAKKLGGPTLRLTMAVYDTGSASTGEITLGLDGNPILLPAHTATIVSVLSDSAGSQFRPLKAQEDLPITFWDMLIYVGPWLLGVLLIVLIYFLVRRLLKRRKQTVEEEYIPPVPPYDEALASLAQLKKDNPLARGDQKGYVTTLVYIVKRLLERTHFDPVLEMTTGEVRRWVREKEVLFDSSLLIELLDAADRVKFAKFPLEPGSGDSLMQATETMVEKYRPDPDAELAKEEGAKGSAIAASPASSWRATVPRSKKEGAE